MDGLKLVSHEHDAEATLANLLQKLVTTDYRSRHFGDRYRRGLNDRLLKETSGVLVRLQQRVDLLSQVQVVLASSSRVRLAGFRGQVEST